MSKVMSICTVVLMLVGGQAMADDFAAPDFRGDPLSYHAEWDLFTNGTFAAGIYTDAESSTDDTDPATNLHTGFGTHLDFSGAGWQLTPPEGGGFFNPNGGTFAANTINWVDFLPEKLLRVQVTYSSGASPTIIGVSGNGPVSGGDPHVANLGGRVDWDSNHFYEDWSIVPNPDWEQIVFDLPAGTIVEQIIIDSVSLPEPATVGLLVVASLLGLRRRRFRGLK